MDWLLKRDPEFVADKGKPGFEVFVQTHASYVPASKVSQGDVLWVKWTSNSGIEGSGLVVAKARVSRNPELGSVSRDEIEKLRNLTQGTRLFDQGQYWSSVERKLSGLHQGGVLHYSVIFVDNDEWLEVPLRPPNDKSASTLISLDSDKRKKDYLGEPISDDEVHSLRYQPEHAGGMHSRRRNISSRLRWKVLCRDNFRCVVCGRKRPDVTLEVDHKLPVARGGSDVIENLQVLCFECNRGKMTDEWRPI